MDAPAIKQLVHTRSYDVTSYLEGEDRLHLRGRVHDVKPPGLVIEDDPDPLSIHEMIVELVVALPELEIVEADVEMPTHPHEECPAIAAHYRRLVGLSIARGFTHQIRELFGGPRGCTHTTALLQAMAPVAVQSLWSIAEADDEPGGGPPTPEAVRAKLGRNLNTCHVWAEDGPMFAIAARGEELPPPLWARERLVSLGRDPSTWGEPSP